VGNKGIGQKKTRSCSLLQQRCKTGHTLQHQQNGIGTNQVALLRVCEKIKYLGIVWYFENTYVYFAMLMGMDEACSWNRRGD